MALIRLFKDPTCSLPIHGRCMRLPLSHALPSYLQQFPSYDRLPHRISEYIHREYGHLSCIDVGANVGDTIAAFYEKDTDTFLAVEPNPRFNKLLVENWGWNRNVTIVADICSSGSSEGFFVIEERNGTASILETENGIQMRRRQLDEIVDDNPSATNANVLKIDTDGHDFAVVAGSKRLLARNLPAILFECDVFKNTNYVEDCLGTLNILKQSGYSSFLLYDNIGHLMGRYSLSDLSPFLNLLFFQLISDFRYFDILAMRDEDMLPFYTAEIKYFADQIPDRSLRRTALSASGL